MNKKKDKKKSSYKKLAIVIFALIAIFVVVIVLYLNPSESTQTNTNASNNSSTDGTVTSVQVTTQTIEKTLSGSGQIASSQTETLSLSTTKYFKELYVEEGDIVKEGANILKYSDGTYLTAPYDCAISAIKAPTVGNKATSDNLVEIKNVKTLYMTLSIDEDDINSVAVGQEATIKITAYSDKSYTGTITKISEIGNYSANGSTFTSTISFENDGNIKIGMSASCEIVLEKAENVIAVPNEAIQTKGNSKYVVVVNADSTTTDVTVETGISNDAYTEIKSGLSGKETIQMTIKSSSSNSSFGNGRVFTMESTRDRNGQSGSTMVQMPQGGPNGGN